MRSKKALSNFYLSFLGFRLRRNASAVRTEKEKRTHQRQETKSLFVIARSWIVDEGVIAVYEGLTYRMAAFSYSPEFFLRHHRVFLPSATSPYPEKGRWRTWNWCIFCFLEKIKVPWERKMAFKNFLLYGEFPAWWRKSMRHFKGRYTALGM